MLEPQHNVMEMGGDFANNPAAEQFIDKMVSKHGFDRQQLHEILSPCETPGLRPAPDGPPVPSGLPPSGPNGARLRYKKQFITPDNVQNGVVFWNQYQDALNRAAGVRRAAGNYCRHYWRRNPLGSRDGQNPHSRRHGDAVV